MNILKSIILLPVPWLERYAMTQGRLNFKGRRMAHNIVLLSVVFLLADSIIAMVRFGELGLQSNWYYTVSIICIGLITRISHPDAEKSINEMKSSTNVVVKGFIYILFGLVLFIEAIAKLLFPLIERIATAVIDSNPALTNHTDEINWIERHRHVDDYMMDMTHEEPKNPW